MVVLVWARHMSILQQHLYPGRQLPENQVHNIWLTPQIPRPTIIAILITILQKNSINPIWRIWF